MTDFLFIKDYKDIEKYRLSFNQLANRIFGLDFEMWYQRGCWNDRYICYSFLHNEQVIANLSVSLMDIIHNQQLYKAVQIGTVMTDPAYRNQGLSRELMNIVIEEYRLSCTFIYLYANKSVLGFYTKFGFTKVVEPSFSYDLPETLTGEGDYRKLNINNEEDWSLLLKLSESRIPVSSKYGVINAGAIFTWYCLNIFHEDIYYLKDLNVIVIYQQEDHILHLYDIVSSKEVGLNELIKLLPINGVNKVMMHYHPGDHASNIDKSYVHAEDTLFIYPITDYIHSDMKLPKIAQA